MERAYARCYRAILEEFGLPDPGSPEALYRGLSHAVERLFILAFEELVIEDRRRSALIHPAWVARVNGMRQALLRAWNVGEDGPVVLAVAQGLAAILTGRPSLLASRRLRRKDLNFPPERAGRILRLARSCVKARAAFARVLPRAQGRRWQAVRALRGAGGWRGARPRGTGAGPSNVVPFRRPGPSAEGTD